MESASTQPMVVPPTTAHEKLVASMVALGGFLADIRGTSNRDEILEQAINYLKPLLPIKVAGFYFPGGEDGEFSLQTELAPAEAEQLNGLVGNAVESGVFGWALKHHRPAAFKTADGQTTLILAGVRTRRRLLGMFAAIFNTRSASGWDASAIILTAYLDSLADAIYTEELLGELQEHNRKLDMLVRQRTQQLESMLEQRQRFMRIAAHDLRNLVTIVSGFAEIGLLGSDVQVMQTALSRVRDGSGRMKAVIEDFLALHAIHRGPGEQFESFDLGSVIGQVVEQSNLAAQSKSITLLTELPTGPLSVRGSLGHTHQILTNYVTNALKYSPSGTQTRISVRTQDNCWRVEVQDQGPGILPEERNKLFVEFARTSNRPTGGEISTGLGLSIVKALAEAQGAKVGAEFPSCGGSIFWLEIPAER